MTISKKLIISSLLLFLLASPALAEDFFYFRSVNYPMTGDYTLTSPTGEVQLKVEEGSIDQRLSVKMMMIVPKTRISNYFTYSDELTPYSDLYFVKFYPEDADKFTTQPKITISYTPDNKYKELYYYNWLNLRFEKLEAERDTINHTLTFELLEKKSMMFALFDEPDISGRASWYVHPKYSGQLVAASRDFAIDTQVKVINLFNDKEVVVTVKDYGPKVCSDWTEEENKKMGPCQERVLDLSKTAFLKLATSTGQGVISEVKVIPIE